MEVVFAKTRHFYQSYTDFYHLLELSLFDTCYVDEIDISRECCYIFTPVNGEYRAHIKSENASGKKKNCIILWWNLERSSPDIHPKMLFEEDRFRKKVEDEIFSICSYIDGIIVSDQYYKQCIPSQVKSFYIPMLGEPGFPACNVVPYSQRKFKYDVCMLSYMVNRRQQIWNKIRSLGVTSAPNGWGKEREEILLSSRCVLNIHQTPAPVIEPLRVLLAGMYSVPFISETVARPGFLQDGVNSFFGSASELPQVVQSVLSRPTDELGEIGSNLNRSLLLNTFSDVVTSVITNEVLKEVARG